MRKFAVIDIGSNSVRLMFVADGKVLYKRLNTTRLGEGLQSSPMMKKDAIERSAQAVANFYKIALENGAEKVGAFATAAVRSAENKEEFLNKVQALCGLEIEVITGEKEAEIGILGALGQKDGAVIDIGGASTELVCKKDNALVYKKSVNIGAVRLKDACARDKEKLFETCFSYVEQFKDCHSLNNVYAIGGTATTLAAWKINLQEYSSDAVTGVEISQKNMQDIAEELLAKSVEEIAQHPCIHSGRADIISGGAVLFSCLMQTLSIKKITVSDRDNLEGYAIDKGWMK